jgi:hypothetical protein
MLMPFPNRCRRIVIGSSRRIPASIEEAAANESKLLSAAQGEVTVESLGPRR